MSETVKENKLSPLEKEELKDIAKAYTEEEYLTIIKVVPDDYLWDELMRRDTAMTEKINFIQDIIGSSIDNLQPIPAKAWQDIRSRYNELKDKFSKIRKGFGK